MRSARLPRGRKTAGRSPAPRSSRWKRIGAGDFTRRLVAVGVSNRSNRSKKSVAVDLKSGRKGSAVVRKLVGPGSDVFVQAFRPGVGQGDGPWARTISARAEHPRLIYANVLLASAPTARKAGAGVGFDGLLQAESRHGPAAGSHPGQHQLSSIRPPGCCCPTPVLSALPATREPATGEVKPRPRQPARHGALPADGADPGVQRGPGASWTRPGHEARKSDQRGPSPPRTGRSTSRSSFDGRMGGRCGQVPRPGRAGYRPAVPEPSPDRQVNSAMLRELGGAPATGQAPRRRFPRRPAGSGRGSSPGEVRDYGEVAGPTAQVKRRGGLDRDGCPLPVVPRARSWRTAVSRLSCFPRTGRPGRPPESASTPRSYLGVAGLQRPGAGRACWARGCRRLSGRGPRPPRAAGLFSGRRAPDGERTTVWPVARRTTTNAHQGGPAGLIAPGRAGCHAARRRYPPAATRRPPSPQAEHDLPPRSRRP